jgi:hypothetical protein
LADGCFVRFQTAEFDAGAAEGFGWREAGVLEVFGTELDVGAKFGCDAGLDFVAGEEGVQVRAELGLHGWNSSVSIFRNKQRPKTSNDKCGDPSLRSG